VEELQRRGYGLKEFEGMFSLGKGTAKRLARLGVLHTIMLGGMRLFPASEVDRIARDGLDLNYKRGGKRKDRGQ
jgi:hypothetical protein